MADQNDETNTVATKLKRSRAGQTQEETNSKSGQEGLYRHPQSGQEVACLYDPLFGNAQAEGAIRVGFERVGDIPEGYIKTVVAGTPQEVADQTVKAVLASDDTTEAIKGLQARLRAVESAESDKDDEILALRAQLEAKQGDQPATKLEASAQTEARNDGQSHVEGINPNDVLNTGGVDHLNKPADDASDLENQNDGEGEGDDEEEDEKPLSKQNSTELKETATREGVEITPELDTNKKLAAAIQAKRDEKKGE